MTKMIESMPPVSVGEYLSRERKTPNTQFKNHTFTLRGRDAIALAVRHFSLKERSTILFPGYLCPIIVRGFSDRFNFEYYDTGRDFSIDAGAIEPLLRGQNVKVLYLIHYFGFLHRNLDQLSKLCRKHGVLLWEDHAHSGLSRISYDFADAMIFSFRKILPVPDGGGLWLRNTPPIQISSGGFSSTVSSMLILARRSRWAMSKGLRARTGQIARLSTASVHEGSKQIVPSRVSYISKRKVLSVDLERAFAVRRDIFGRWQHLLDDSRFEPVFATLPDDICPQGFPIWIRNGRELVRNLQDFDVFLKVHWPLHARMKERCPTAFDVSQSIITLPIYPGLQARDMERILTLLGRYGEPLAAEGD
ncbi:MAG: DegT/DnrJ/EryC1/StrS family aminotransferase [Deltaproteobacteria bacterium]|nr:DegT/DnrJ/EryC1/StrS family aminotransferase [Deltaproteobacteria bacterium]